MIDPIGLALENFDVTGAWRIRDNGSPVDAASTFYDGTPLAGPADLRQALLKRSDVLMQHVHREPDDLRARPPARRADMPTVRAIVRQAAAAGSASRRSCLAIVKSPAFRMKSADDTPTATIASGATVDALRPGESTRHVIHYREALRGGRAARLGATVALPFLDAMVPAAAVERHRAAAALERTRLVCIEMVHGAAGQQPVGRDPEPVVAGRDGAALRPRPSALSPLEPFRKYLTIVSDTDVRSAEAVTQPEIGGDHFRSSAVFLTQAHPKQTESSDVRAGISLDQIYAQRFGQDTPIPSMQLCIENVDQAGGCAYGYSCVYTDMISWASPTEPLPMIRDPRMAFDQLFGAGGSPASAPSRRRATTSVLDYITGAGRRSESRLDASDRQRMERYLEDVREIERRIQKVEARNTSGEARELPGAPAGVPDSFDEHVKLMFDLQALAFQADVTRVFSFKMGRDASSRVYPESGVTKGFHPRRITATSRRP